MSWASFAGGVGLSLGGRLFDRVADDIFGIPGPSGKELGKRSLDYFNTAFPGTNPWERLGSPSPASGMVAADAAQRNANRQASTAIKVKKDELQTSRRNVDKQTDAQKEVARTNERAAAYTARMGVQQALINERASRFGSTTSAGATTTAAGISAGASRDVADVGAGATMAAANIGARGTVRSAEIAEQARKFAAKLGADTQLDVVRIQADASMFSSVMATQDPGLINEYFRLSGRNDQTIAGTLKSKEVNAKLLNLDADTLGKVADNFLKNAQVPFAEELARAGLTKEQTSSLWTFLENTFRGNTESGWWVIGATGIGAAARGVMALFRLVRGKSVKTMTGKQHYNFRDKTWDAEPVRKYQEVWERLGL